MYPHYPPRTVPVLPLPALQWTATLPLSAISLSMQSSTASMVARGTPSNSAHGNTSCLEPSKEHGTGKQSMGCKYVNHKRFVSLESTLSLSQKFSILNRNIFSLSYLPAPRALLHSATTGCCRISP